MECCPHLARFLMVVLMSAPLVIVAVACSNSPTPSTPAGKSASPDTSSSKPKEPAPDLRP